MRKEGEEDRGGGDEGKRKKRRQIYSIHEYVILVQILTSVQKVQRRDDYFNPPTGKYFQKFQSPRLLPDQLNQI